MKNEWDDYAQAWDTDASVKAYASNAFQSLQSQVALNSSMRVLDFGCGTGALTQHLTSCGNNFHHGDDGTFNAVGEIVALDASPEMIKCLEQKQLANVNTICDYLTPELIETTPQLCKPFDLIVASSVCAFLPDYQATLALLKSLLVKGGVFIQWDWLAKTDDEQTGFTLNHVRSAFEKNQFTDITVEMSFTVNSPKGEQAVLMAIGKH